MLTGQNGILNRAVEAKNKTEASKEKEKTSLVTMEELIDEYGKNSKGWKYLYNANGMPEKVTNGQGTTLTIGDYINYNPADYTDYDENKNGFYNSQAGTVQDITYTETKGSNTYSCTEASIYQEKLDKGEVIAGNGYSNQNFKVSNANEIKWRVLGADEATGELLIIADDVLKENNAPKQLILGGITGYLYGIDELNKVCNIYGKGKGATGARSVTLDDVNKAVGKEKETITEKWTYLWTENSLDNNGPSYDDGKNYTIFPHIKDNSTVGVFNYYNTTTRKWETLEKNLTGFTGKENITTISTDYTGYDMETDTDSSNYEINRMTNGYKVLFKENMTEDDKYWLASSYCNADFNFANWGTYCIYATGGVGGEGEYYSFGLVGLPRYGVRPVVSLKSDIKLQSTSVENGITTYNIEE